MTSDPPKYHRRSIRLREYDYSWAGWYYVTVCSHKRECVFGEVKGDKVVLAMPGEILVKHWDDLPNHYPIELDSYVVMPNHLHGIIIIKDQSVGAIHVNDPAKGGESPLQERIIQRRKMLLPKIIGRFKMETAKEINLLRKTRGVPVWQRNYHEHVIRNDADLHRIRTYIQNNPLQWAIDEENPINIKH
jgi:putative transposase